MSKAEDRALSKYPVLETVLGDINYLPRFGFLEGYHQAEKDLELTWDDIPKILHICEQLKTKWWFRDDEQTKQIGRQPFWEEVLRIFKTMKDGKED